RASRVLVDRLYRQSVAGCRPGNGAEERMRRIVARNRVDNRAVRLGLRGLRLIDGRDRSRRIEIAAGRYRLLIGARIGDRLPDRRPVRTGGGGRLGAAAVAVLGGVVPRPAV